MTDRPIIFSAPMIRAMLDGRKTQTRRVLKPQPEWIASSGRWKWPIPKSKRHGCNAVVTASREWHEYLLPHQKPYARGDRLRVKEGWNVSHKSELAPGESIERPLADCVAANGGFSVAACDGVVYRATGAQEHPTLGKARWRSPIHMPRWASRLTLTVTDVRVQRLQEISEADARAEGAAWHDGRGLGHSGWRHDLSDVHADARSSFARLWNSIHGPDAWASNPWVVAMTFDVHRRNIDQMGEDA